MAIDDHRLRGLSGGGHFFRIKVGAQYGFRFARRPRKTEITHQVVKLFRIVLEIEELRLDIRRSSGSCSGLSGS